MSIGRGQALHISLQVQKIWLLVLSKICSYVHVGVVYAGVVTQGLKHKHGIYCTSGRELGVSVQAR